MARSIGLPARVAVGFTPGAYDQAFDIFHVTTKEAHAWPEVHINGMGWVAFEPTPGRFEPEPDELHRHLQPVGQPGPGHHHDHASATEPGRPDADDRAGRQRPEEDPFETERDLGRRRAGPVAGPGRRRPCWRWPWCWRCRRPSSGGGGPGGGGPARPGPGWPGAWSEALDRLREAGTAPAATLTPMEFARGGARSVAADVGLADDPAGPHLHQGVVLARRPVRGGGQPGLGRGRDADQGARLQRLGPGPLAAPPEPGDAPAAGRLASVG